MQLVAYGAQDIYLTGNPQITFFKVVYRRHTNFSMESIVQTINGYVTTSCWSTVTISRNGDLVHKVYVTSSTPAITNGDEIIADVELEIGGQRIDNAKLMTDSGNFSANTSASLKVFAVNYNVLRIMSGMGGLAYSN